MLPLVINLLISPFKTAAQAATSPMHQIKPFQAQAKQVARMAVHEHYNYLASSNQLKGLPLINVATESTTTKIVIY